MSRMCRKVPTSVVSKIVDSSGFGVSIGAERPPTHTWLSGYQSPGAQPANPEIGVSPALAETANANESVKVKKVFLIILSPIFLLDCDTET